MKIKINFSDFWNGFDKRNNYFTNYLSQYFDIEISNHPDFLIYSSYGFHFKKYSCIRIFYTADYVRPNFAECDFAFSFDYSSDNRNYRLPYYGLRLSESLTSLLSKDKIPKDVLSGKKFCNMIYSNQGATERIDFFHELSSYKKVDSGGKVLNNLGYRVDNKIEFIKDYKFTFAFENSSYNGYTTEKIIEPFFAASIPIYWGNPNVTKEFNPKSFINVHDYPSYNEVIQRIIEIDNNDDLFLEYINQPCFVDNKMPENIKIDNVMNRFEYIFAQKGVVKPVANKKQLLQYYFNSIRGKLGYLKKKLTTNFKLI